MEKDNYIYFESSVSRCKYKANADGYRIHVMKHNEKHWSYEGGNIKNYSDHLVCDFNKALRKHKLDQYYERR